MGTVGDCFDCEDNGVVLGSYAGRTVRPATMENPYRTRHRYLRVPRDLPQPATPPHRLGHAHPDRIRENPLPQQTNRRTADPSELTPRNRGTIKPSTKTGQLHLTLLPRPRHQSRWNRTHVIPDTAPQGKVPDTNSTRPNVVKRS